jgi:hypothetical protein
MPHETEIIIKSLTQPVRFGEAPAHEEDHKPAKCRVWWFPAALVVAFVVGALVG